MRTGLLHFYRLFKQLNNYRELMESERDQPAVPGRSVEPDRPGEQEESRARDKLQDL